MLKIRKKMEIKRLQIMVKKLQEDLEKYKSLLKKLEDTENISSEKIKRRKANSAKQ